jgi:hypothetical protein
MKTTLMSGALLASAILFIPVSSVQAGPFQECVSSGETRATCACERALRIGTKSALNQFMRNYDDRGTACEATASTSSSGGVRLVSPDQSSFGNYPTSNTGHDDISSNPN